MGTKVKLKNVRIAFCDTLIDPKEYEAGDGKFRHSATFLIEPGSDNAKAIEAAIKGEAATVWQKKADAILTSIRGNSNKFCYCDGNAKDYDGFEDMMYIASHRKAADGKPLLMDSLPSDEDPTRPAKLLGKDGKWVPGKEGRIYAGCYVNATIEIYAQAGANSGMRCGLMGIQFYRDGDSFSGASRAKDDDFEPIEAPEMVEDDIA
jgi:hypothetical protein